MKSGPPSIEGFKILRLLRSGPGGDSYLAVERGRRRRPLWVVKAFRPTGSGKGGSPGGTLRDDFCDLSSLAHPSLALPILVLGGSPAGSGYLLRPFREGLAVIPAAQGRSTSEVLAWLIAAAEALGLLHRFGFLHRNVKASNLIVPRAALFKRGSREPRIILADPAWWPEGNAGSGAPEVRTGEPGSIASDLHALGAVFYRLLTGEDPRADAGAAITPLSELNAEVPVDLERSVLKLLHPEPARRYRSAGELVEDLVRLGGSRSTSLAAPECFLDRETELGRALDRLSPPGRPAVLAVAGEAGMGKSALLRRITLAAQLLGYRTASARFFRDQARSLSAVRSLAQELIPPAPQSGGLSSRCRRLLGAPSTGPGTEEGPEPGVRKMLVRGLLDVFAELGRHRPTLLVLDRVEDADALSLEFLAGLIRDLAAPKNGAAVQPSLALLFSFRNESPFRPVLRPLLEAINAPGSDSLLLELSPLPREAVEEWLNLFQGEAEGEGREELLSRLRGKPFLIREAVRLPDHRIAKVAGSPPDFPALHRSHLAALPGEERTILETLAVLGRPASLELLQDVAHQVFGEKKRLRPAVGRLLADGTLTEESGLLFFRHGSFQSWTVESLEQQEARAIHRRIARSLGRGAQSSEEIARHWLLSDEPARGVPAALKAAAQLVRGHEDRRAADLFLAALEHLPRGKERQAAAGMAAESLARVGEHRRALALLREALLRSEGRESGRLQGRMGVFLHRAGEPAKAVTHLEKALSLLSGARGARWFRERLRVESELAEIRSNEGRDQEAERICARALGEIAQARKSRQDPWVRRSEMVLLENLAHLKLRRFQYPEARELFERSLRAGERLGLVPEKGLILNNLGILHIQENRFPQAIECYQRARRVSARLGDDPSLAAIESNLAVLYAKVGEPEASDEALRRAAHHESRCDSLRTRCLRLHSAGLVDLLFGRLPSAIEALEAAIALADELKDTLTRSFDLVYLADCHLLRGEPRAARAALERALGPAPAFPRPIRPMVHARRALLAALKADGREARGEIAAHAECGIVEVPYLHAWNLLALGWAQRLLGEGESARASLEEARSFFSRTGVPAGEVQAALELAALEADAGRPARASKILGRILERTPCGQGALRNPLLSARLLLYRTRSILDGERPDLEEAASSLAEAEGFLIGRRLDELESLARALRRRLREKTLERRPALPGLPHPRGGRFLEDGLERLEVLRETALALIRRFEEELNEDAADSLRRQLRLFEESLHSERRLRDGRTEQPFSAPGADSIIGRSPAMRRVADLCRQTGPTLLPVLITGETGTGKELVARVIHGESVRRAAPFISLSSAALPAELFEAELFGSVRGAYSGAEKDRPGLLASARGGTFLFDEIGEMPLPLQAKILRVLERGRARPLGGVEEVEIDVRYLFTTHRDLPALMEEGKFRRDLFYRLRGIEIPLPPLRERLQDLPELVEHFLNLLLGTGRRDREGPDVVHFGEEALCALASYLWPGNVRELGNAVSRLALTSRGRIGEEEVRHFLGETRPGGVFPPALLRSRPVEQLLSLLEREHLLQLLADRGGSLEETAKALGIKVRALYDRLHRLGIPAREGRKAR